MIDSSLTEGQIRFVANFQDLVSTAFRDNINALCWDRTLKGDFSEIVKKVELGGNMTTLDQEQLRALELSEQGQLARDILMDDWQLLEDHGASPILNVIKSYERDDSFFPTDVYSFHVDRATVPSSTFLCTYHGASSEILPNAQAIQKVLVPEIREELKSLYDGAEEGFESFLEEYFFDLHYQAKPEAQPISLGIGQLWRLAIDHPGRQVLPCVHRAPLEKTGEHRLMMIC